MNDFHIDFEEEYLEDIELEIGEIDAETDVAILIEWYERAVELIAEISDDVEFKRSVDRATDSWIWRAGRKIAYLKKGLRRIEQRILRLGGMPPYPLNDGRANQIRILERKVQQAKDALLSNNIPLPWEKLPRDSRPLPAWDETRSGSVAEGHRAAVPKAIAQPFQSLPPGES